AVSNQNITCTGQPWRLIQDSQASYLSLVKSSIRRAQVNSVDKMAKDAKTISQPGPGYGIATIPINSMMPPTAPMTDRLVSLPILSKRLPTTNLEELSQF